MTGSYVWTATKSWNYAIHRAGCAHLSLGDGFTELEATELAAAKLETADHIADIYGGLGGPGDAPIDYVTVSPCADVKHETEGGIDGRVRCKACGEESARLGTEAKKREWGVWHRREVRKGTQRVSG